MNNTFAGIEFGTIGIYQLFTKMMDEIGFNDHTDIYIKSGYALLDNLIGGLCLGELTVVCGRPFTGKTQMLTTLALNISSFTPTLYYTYELSGRQLIKRLISQLSDVPLYDIWSKTIFLKNNALFQSLEKKISDYHFFINDSTKSIEEFKEECQKQIQENDVKVIIVDYLQLMNHNTSNEKGIYEKEYITGELKNFAKENNICVIAASQLKKTAELRFPLKVPEIADLPDGWGIEHFADTILFITKPECQGVDNGEVENCIKTLKHIIVVAKNKNIKQPTQMFI
jgi:replicative DNA helicase